MRAEDFDLERLIIIRETTAWAASDLPMNVFRSLVDDLESSDLLTRAHGRLIFDSPEIAGLVLGGRRRKARRPRQ